MTATALRIGIAVLVLMGVGVLVRLSFSTEPTTLDPNDPQLVARGKVVYDEHCARCHGADLEGQPG